MAGKPGAIQCQNCKLSFSRHIIHMLDDKFKMLGCPDSPSSFFKDRDRAGLTKEALESNLQQSLTQIPILGNKPKPHGYSFSNGIANVHPHWVCEPNHENAQKNCVIHNPSDHEMRMWPMVLIRKFVWRLCTHWVLHPDPDALRYFENSNDGVGVHDCDACCDL